VFVFTNRYCYILFEKMCFFYKIKNKNHGLTGYRLLNTCVQSAIVAKLHFCDHGALHNLCLANHGLRPSFVRRMVPMAQLPEAMVAKMHFCHNCSQTAFLQP
jgi:hypothetical protein